MSTQKTTFEATDVDLEDWIGGVSFLQASHTIYRNPAMWAEYQPILDKIDALEREIEDLTAQDEPTDAVVDRSMAGEEPLVSAPAPTGDRTLGDKPVEPPRVAELRDELETMTKRANEMWEQYESDVEVWRLRKLEESELHAIKAELGELPAEPRGPSKNAKPPAITAYTRRFDAWLKNMAEYGKRYNLRCVAKATLSVTVAGVDRGTITPEQMDRVLARPGGEQHVTELVTVLEQLSLEGVDIVAPHRPRA